MYDLSDTGIALAHPLFRDVYFILKERFFVQEKNVWKIKVVWKHKRTQEVLATENLTVTQSKMKEFIKYEE